MVSWKNSYFQVRKVMLIRLLAEKASIEYLLLSGIDRICYAISIRQIFNALVTTL